MEALQPPRYAHAAAVWASTGYTDTAALVAPSTFEEHLTALIAVSDLVNQRLLARVYPEYVAVYQAYILGGPEALQAIAEGLTAPELTIAIGQLFGADSEYTSTGTVPS